MKLTLLAAAIALVASNAHALRGNVVDQYGSAVSGAKIDVIGDDKVYMTDQQGQFDIPQEDIDEIHIEAKGFSHKILHLHGEYTEPMTITLFQGVLEIVDVIGLPMHASIIESAQPVSVLAGDELRKRQASTLGETLKNEVGVHSNYYGGVTGSPVIRGLDGPRVLITQNGLDVSDASRVGPDHVVATEASTAEQIEILRGPATLFYGSGAIGGVVNIVDDRVPSDSEQKAAFLSEYNSVNDERMVSAAYTGGNDTFAFHADGFLRESNDIDIPGQASLERDDDDGTLENSASESSGFNIGGSLLLDDGYIGISYGRLNRLNGIPGHAHEEGHEENNEDPEAHEEEEQVLSDLKQDRWQLLSDFSLDNAYIASVNTRIGYTEYEHAEIHEYADEEMHEGHEHEEGTVFKNTSLQARMDLLHHEIGGWKGAISFEAKNIDFEAIGEEAFTPPSETNEMALAIIEEKHVGKLLWQLGARIEQSSLSADDVMLAGHEHEEGPSQGGEILQFDTFDFTPMSFSAGLVWDFTQGYNLGLSLAHAERAPSAAELFSVGPHIATRAFEAGALFEIHQEDGESHLEYTGNAEKEVSNNIDLTLRKFEGNVGFVINVFYNEISNYYSLTNTGLTTEDLFSEHGGEEPLTDETHEHEDALPVYIFEQEDATLYGVEWELAWQFHPYMKWIVWGDTVRAELDNGEPLPRISPTRLGSQLQFERGSWAAQLHGVNYYDQNRAAINETATEGYTLIDARVSYSLPLWQGNTSIYVAGDNLTNEDARVHTSFLKDQAPLPGRNIKLGLQMTF